MHGAETDRILGQRCKFLHGYLACTGVPAVGCKKWQVRHKQKKELRALRQKQKEKDKEKLQKYEDAVRHQASIQDKKTRKAMKKKYRKAQRYNNHQKEFFLKRWFKGGKKRQAHPQRRNRE